MAMHRSALFVRGRARHAAPVQLPRAAGAAGLASATALAFVPGSATAAPSSSPDEVARQIAALDVQAETATEDYAEAQLALDEAQRRSDAVQARIAEEQAR